MALTEYDIKKLQKNPRFFEKALADNLQSLETSINNVSAGSGTGDVTNGSNLGAGTGLFTSKAAGVLQFKSLQATGYVSLTNSGTEVTINGTSISLPQSAGWESSYTTVNANSAAWFLSGTDVYLGDIPELSASWNSVYTQVKNLSDSWEESIDVSNISAQVVSLQISSIAWDSSWSQVNTLSSGWMLSGTEVDLGDILSLSAGWNSVYTTVNESSSRWESVYIDVNSLSSNWQSVYSNVNDASGSWVGVWSQVNSLSTGWMLSGTEVDLGDIPLLSGSWNSVFNTVNESSGLWDLAFSSVCALSASWAGGGSDVSSLTGNWESSYTTVNTTSSNWNVYSSKNATIGCSFNGMGSALDAGLKTYLTIPYDCRIKKWYLIANVSGNLVIDVWNDTWANFPPTVADSIAGTEKPTLVAQQSNKDEDLATWSPNISEGDVMCFKVDSCDTIINATLTMQAEKI